jgi:gamma-D-glutamyl-L-lysine dipeptidyl-peptidase
MSTYDPFVAGEAVVAVPVTTVWAEPDAPRDIDKPITQDVPRIERWMSALDVAHRLDLQGRVNTQALMGESVIVVAERNGWSEVRLPWQPTSLDTQGFPGWIRSAHLLPSFDTSDRRVVVQSRLWFDEAFPEPVSIGSVLNSPDPLSIRLPNGTVISLTSPRNLWSDGSDAQGLLPLLAQAVDTDAVKQRAKQFLGVSYLWGGLSGWGVDCSGLVHIAARAAGVIVARDSVDQYQAAANGGFELEADELRWFSHPNSHERGGRIRHVAFAVPGNRLLHAPRSGFSVEIISATEEPYDADAVTHRSD